MIQKMRLSSYKTVAALLYPFHLLQSYSYPITHHVMNTSANADTSAQYHGWNSTFGEIYQMLLAALQMSVAIR